MMTLREIAEWWEPPRVDPDITEWYAPYFPEGAPSVTLPDGFRFPFRGEVKWVVHERRVPQAIPGARMLTGDGWADPGGGAGHFYLTDSQTFAIPEGFRFAFDYPGGFPSPPPAPSPLDRPRVLVGNLKSRIHEPQL